MRLQHKDWKFLNADATQSYNLDEDIKQFLRRKLQFYSRNCNIPFVWRPFCPFLVLFRFMSASGVLVSLFGRYLYNYNNVYSQCKGHAAGQ